MASVSWGDCQFLSLNWSTCQPPSQTKVYHMLFGRNKGSLYGDTVLSCDVVAVPAWCHVCVSVDCCLPITCVTMETTTVLYLQGDSVPVPSLCPCLFHCPSCHTLLLSFPFLPPPFLSPPSLPCTYQKLQHPAEVRTAQWERQEPRGWWWRCESMYCGAQPAYDHAICEGVRYVCVRVQDVCMWGCEMCVCEMCVCEGARCVHVRVWDVCVWGCKMCMCMWGCVSESGYLQDMKCVAL